MNCTLLKGVHLSEIPCIDPDLPFADEEMLKAFEAAKPKLGGIRLTPLITGTAGEIKCMYENCSMCKGTGISKLGGMCVHSLVCNCPKCKIM